MNVTERLRRLRHIALDLDGTVYKDDVLFPPVPAFLATLRRLGLGFTFVTNNSSRSTTAYVAKLRRLGIEITADEIHSSTHAAIAYLEDERPEARRLFVLGTASLREELAAHGFELAGESPADPPDAVVVGFDTALVFERLCRAAWWIAAGKPFIATHPDRVCPTAAPTVLVDCGSICAALTHATGRAPEAVPGKPDSRMLAGLTRRAGVNAAELAMVGDRLYTDMAMARAAGALAVLALTGETSATDVADAAAEESPDIVVSDLDELRRLLEEAATE